MSDPQHQPNPTASVYALRYLRLLDIVRDERATEPRLNTAKPAEWLNWAHAARWLIRLMYDSCARAIAHGDMMLPTVCSQSNVQALVNYLDGVFATMTTQHSFLGSPYPAIAWSPNQVIVEQADSDAGRPLPSIRYLDHLLQLSDLRSSAHGWDNLVCRVQVVFLAQREQASEAREGLVGVHGWLNVVEGQMDNMAATLLRILHAIHPPSRDEGVDEAVDML